MIYLCRAYDNPGETKGTRVLVDRLWPRGISKERLGLELWMREIAPSDHLRKWYSHDMEKWEEFKARYFSELDAAPQTTKLLQLCKSEDVVFIFSSKELERNNAVALKEYVEQKIGATE